MNAPLYLDTNQAKRLREILDAAPVDAALSIGRARGSDIRVTTMTLTDSGVERAAFMITASGTSFPTEVVL